MQMIIKKWITNNSLEKSDTTHTYPVIKTESLSREKLWELRSKVIRKFYLRPSYLLKRIFNLKSLYELKMSVRQGLLYLISSFNDGL